MLSKQEIMDQVNDMVNLIDKLCNEKETNWRKFCNEARKHKETQQELAEANFRIEKAINYIKGFDSLCSQDKELLSILEGKYE